MTRRTVTAVRMRFPWKEAGGTLESNWRLSKRNRKQGDRSRTLEFRTVAQSIAPNAVTRCIIVSGPHHLESKRWVSHCLPRRS